MSVSAYKRTMRETESPREIERRIFSRITAALATYAETHDNAESEMARMQVMAGSLKQALAENIRLWSALKADLAHPDNALQPDLRAGLLSLALFVERQTRLVLRGEGKVAPLVSTNQRIIEGLAGNSSKDAA